MPSTLVALISRSAPISAARSAAGVAQLVQLAEARGLELRSQTQLNQSVVELQRVDGTILTTNGVNLQTLGTQTLAH